MGDNGEGHQEAMQQTSATVCQTCSVNDAIQVNNASACPERMAHEEGLHKPVRPAPRENAEKRGSPPRNAYVNHDRDVSVLPC